MNCILEKDKYLENNLINKVKFLYKKVEELENKINILENKSNSNEEVVLDETIYRSALLGPPYIRRQPGFLYNKKNDIDFENLNILE